MTQLYAQQADCVAASSRFSSWFEWDVPAGGMFVWATARHASIDTDRLVPAAMDAGVMVGPSSVFDPWGQNRHALRLNFTRRMHPPFDRHAFEELNTR
ncbi:hypothetical protein [Burkholderia sp. Ac-20353]|uniref:hypothetical protein n=1 Tax=Burkholderia sp. Ac-20353 TaxID=2703894 RepID=UPI00197C0689|nr:hypothetical protein [Burkholderia sp. Ac-20353]MBN3787447.1 hypothetical protein [Burkholderia sp. Ac-20353]